MASVNDRSGMVRLPTMRPIRANIEMPRKGPPPVGHIRIHLPDRRSIRQVDPMDEPGSTTDRISFTANGQPVSVTAREVALLLDVLRHPLNLRGVRFGRGKGARDRLSKVSAPPRRYPRT